MNNQILLESFELPVENQQHVDALRYIIENEVDVDVMFEGVKALEKLHNKYNELVLELGIDESCLVKPNDTAATIRKKCKKAFGHGLKMEPMRQIYAVDNSPISARLPSVSGGAMGEAQLSYSYGVSAFDGMYKKRTPPDEKETLSRKWSQVDPDSALNGEEELDEEKSSTERVRKYYKRHPDKVKAYLRKTVDDRVKRNKDRREAVKRHGKSKMKNHDVHHPNGVNGSWELADKDHGRDKKDDKKKTPTQKTQPKKQPAKKTTPTIDPTIKKFLDFAIDKIGIENAPKLVIIEPSGEMSSLGAFDPQTNRIMLVTKGRLMADVLRTLAHELVHVKQNELGKITDPIRDGEDGSPIENQANAAAGVLMRQFGRENKNIYLSEGLLVEGGAAGHMTHPFEDKDLTFGDMKTMIDRALIGSLDVEEPATEKLDGQNIAFTVREDGNIVFARNKGHVKNRGQNALDVAGIRQMFSGRGAIEKAFGGAAEDLAAAVEKLTPDQRQELFAGGSRFMNIEVILPDSQNVIPYGRSVLVMHGTIEYDESGNEVSRDNDAGRSFAKAVRQVGADRQKTFGIEGPRTIAFDESVDEELEAKADEYKATIDRAAATFDLGDDAKLEDYRRAWWEREIEQMDSNQNLGLSPQQKESLVSRWADGDKKAIGVKDLETPEQKEWFRTFEADELQNAQKKMIRPIEYSFLKTGAQALKRVTGWMAANNPEAAAQIRKDTLEAIKGIKDSDDPDLIAKMQQQFDKLEAMGLDNVVPSEGIVFTYNGNLYKFTGTFAPINQITGTFKFGMPPKTEEKPEEPKKEPVEEPKAEKPEEPTPEPTEEPTEAPRTVAIFAGRFHPFHRGHYSVYQNLVDRFGKENVYIASSGVQKDPAKQPFSFDQKKDIITQMFDVPDDMVVQVKNPYAPSEILDKLPDNTTYVTAVSQKDADRLSGSKYFRSIEDAPEGDRVGYKEGGYFVVTPEFQLDIDGKNVSGTQLRHVMGSPKYTDRAKEEIFTKVYGRFDQDIFDMVTKVTAKAEEEREKTEKYTEKKPVAGEEPTAKRQATKPDAGAMGRAKSVLTQKVFNPDTQRDILVATALKYVKGHPARQEAERMVQQAMQQNEIITEAAKSKPKRLKLYTYTRDYSNKELENEIGEYFENEETLKLFPRLAKDKKELRSKILDAPTVVLSRKELLGLANSEVPEILSGGATAKVLKKLETKYEKDVRGVLKAVKNEAEMALPIVISHPKGLYLMGGNTRLSVLASIGHTMPVKVLDYKDAATADPNTGALPGPTSKELTRQQYRKKFEDIMKMTITNPETGNQVKIDTAMDYKKEHPAHQIALGIIRQQLGNISPTAGIPKQRRYS